MQWLGLIVAMTAPLTHIVAAAAAAAAVAAAVDVYSPASADK